MRFAVALAVAVPLVSVLACSSPGKPAKAEPTVDNQQQIVSRLTNDIWPAVSAYNLQPTQASPGAKQFRAILDPSLQSATAGDAYNALRDAAQKLGQQGQYDPATQTTHSNDGLAVAHADVQSVQDDAATLNVCYTYDHSWYVNIQNTQHAPGSSEATVQLVKANNTWYLHSIANDHVVPNCGAVNG
ncbi:hypothetical protein [Mycolicibacterium sp. CBMA 226]|uniref:hypothetical protein n=1 Tax=Mycolicibacterium sp. CBMA 226 TaxID=2606611 RepID=UPI0012DE67CC|nr:hypothetical protein [Mycolicibacterium sp. CBMA 226]MUL75720.1 hypothetical protein [Mycolicibacterium sp. CBMA 226]